MADPAVKLQTYLNGQADAPPPIDRRLYDTIFAEVGGGHPHEVMAVGSVFLNRIKKDGYEKALEGSSAYRKQSPQYKLASSGKLTTYEQSIYQRNKNLIDFLIQNPQHIQPFDYMENVKAYGTPSWAKGKKYVDIGRQRFYMEGK
jgi:hypothetical protein